MAHLPARLLEGYAAFKSGKFRSESERYEELYDEGQNPEIMLIGCCDSRATPSDIFNAGPGEMFVVRNVANIVPAQNQQMEGLHGTAAALEFAVKALKVKHIVIMGHGRCGGVAAYISEDMEPLSEGNYIGQWSAQLAPADKPERLSGLNRPDLDHQGLLERSSIMKSIENLMSYGFVREAVVLGNLDLHGAWFDIREGHLEYYDRDDRSFKTVTDA